LLCAEDRAVLFEIQSRRILGRYHNALLLGETEKHVRCSESSGNYPLVAYICAMMNGLKDDSETNGVVQSKAS